MVKLNTTNAYLVLIALFIVIFTLQYAIHIVFGGEETKPQCETEQIKEDATIPQQETRDTTPEISS